MSNLETLFAQAIELQDEKALNEFLVQNCDNDQELESRIRELVAAHRQDQSLLDEPMNVAQTTNSNRLPDSVQEGAIVGNYKLLQQIGEGGFGVVFMAQQMEPISRRVAIKIIKPGMDSKEVIARFEAERQALAMMDHPNIAKVFDAGTTESGYPFFVMELVQGISITEYADENNLSSKGRLKLFKQVCKAIQHAHQKGIIHRDIKPSNVMITLHDGDPVPKVIDFGISKATNQQLTQKTLFTRYGQIVGTPQYMSPEQAEMNEYGVDTKSDIYSLGVILYELLTGNPPFDGESLCQAGFDEMRKIIREKDPKKPSERLKTLDQKTATAVAKRRSCAPSSLTKLVTNELDVIVMKSLEKNRERRFESAGEFANEIQRYLDGDPILSTPPSYWYMLSRTLRKHKAIVATTATIVLITTSAAIISFLFYRDAVNSRDEALVAQHESEEQRALTQQAVSDQRKLYETLTKEKETVDEAIKVVTRLIDIGSADELADLAGSSPSFFSKDPQKEYFVLSNLANELIKKNELPIGLCTRISEVARKGFGANSVEYCRSMATQGLVSRNADLLERSIEIDKQNGRQTPSSTFCLLGSVLVQNREFDKAILTLNQSVACYEREAVNWVFYEVPFLWLADAYRETGNHKLYTATIEKGIDEVTLLRPNPSAKDYHNASRLNIYPIRAQTRNFKWYLGYAEWLALIAIRKLPEDADPHFEAAVYRRLAWVYQSMGKVLLCQGALARANKILENVESSHAKSNSLALNFEIEGRNFGNVGDHKNYENSLRKSLELTPSKLEGRRVSLQFELALVLSANGNKEEASELFLECSSVLGPYAKGHENLWGTPWDSTVFAIAEYCLNKGAANEIEQIAANEIAASDYHKEAFSWLTKVCVELSQKRFNSALTCFENCFTQLDFALMSFPMSIVEMELLKKLRTNVSDVKLLETMKKILDFRTTNLAFGHPQLGLTYLRYAEFLVEHKMNSALASKWLLEAERLLADQPMLPQIQIEKIANLNRQLADTVKP